MSINAGQIHGFLRIDGIEGESRDHEHPKWIEIENLVLDFEQSRSATASSQGGNTAARVKGEPIEIMKVMDAASTALFQACCNGTTCAKIEIQLMRADGKDGKAINYFKLEAMNVVVQRVITSLGPDGLPRETVRLAYAAMKQTYIPQLSGGGSSGNKVAQYSFSQNKQSYTA